MKTICTNGCRPVAVGAAWPRGAEWVLALLVGLVWSGSAAHARPAPPPLEDPARWATITHPGNAPHSYIDEDGLPRLVGTVDYEFRISRTEVTTGEWVEFVRAYAPYVPASDQFRSWFTSDWVFWNGQTYAPLPGTENLAANMNWRYAARYVNWLHNNKAMHQGAFESGVYDTGTFSTNPDGTFNDQRVRSPGARFWLPSEDEWVKAGYFDPHRHGANQPGYWQYNISSDTAPVTGPPGVGQTNAPTQGQSEPSEQYPVMSYPNVVSPWGLWDMTGGYNEWLEDVFYRSGATMPRERLARGSHWALWTQYDRISKSRAQGIQTYSTTIRLARLVPSSSTVGCVALLGARSLCRRRG